MASIVPMAKGLTLCDRVVGRPLRKVDLFGVFNAIRPANGYPHDHGSFRVFAQLGGGLGRVEFTVEIRAADTDEQVWSSDLLPLLFADRAMVLQVSVEVEECVFPRPGVYLVELYCNNAWACDTRLILHQPAGDLP